MRIPFVVLAIRSAIFCFWIAAIGSFLMIPTFMGYFTYERSLTIFTWPSLLDPIYLKKFEHETGIKLYITYFENGPALLSKMAATQSQGYDLVIPDDYSLKLLIEQGLIKKLDRSKLDFWNKLDPILLGNYSDPLNEYSIPYYWGVYGVGYDANVFKNGPPPATWEVLFPKGASPHYRICMTDDAREAIMLAAYYLFGSIDALKDKEARQKVKQLLIDQKKNVEVYTISRSDNLLQSKSCGVAAIMSPEVWRLHREHPHIDMVIPQDGSFVVVDSMAIPRSTDKDDMIYQFLNFVYRNEVIQHHTDSFGYCSPLRSSLTSTKEQFCPIERFKTFDFFRNVISDDEINALWIEVLAA